MNMSKTIIVDTNILCREIDQDDTLVVALTLELDGLLWTSDKKLITGLRERGFDKFFGEAILSLTPQCN
ncbi:nucleotide-binding protein, PIN domain-containing protein [Thioploca ingrica]|uniref:Nucleotide-binding protein, PIN domain-containing protein n=1 Tax=Thioploca ingrica TaxID=40754 RepID=A0A090ALE5_9GAMM|nr:nucleotide-binding protein, PIN domain-containing protein [Thioploca ingrica]